MIDKTILDEVLPELDRDELMEEKTEELASNGFAITNFHSGGIFYSILAIICQVRVEIRALMRTVLNSMYLSHATGAWLDLKLADFAKKRKAAQKTQGLVTVSRRAGSETQEAVRIAKGHTFRTIKDIVGDELRYFALEDTVLKKDEEAAEVLVEAEKAGAAYNVPAGQITRSLTHLEGDLEITNGEGWITQEGADEEDDESARERGLGAWSELAAIATRDKIKNVAEGVPGVLFCNVDDEHPRGQGTVDVIITGTAGEATEGLLSAVREAVDKIIGPYDNVQYMSSTTFTQPIEVAVTIAAELADDDLTAIVYDAITELLQIQKGRELHELYHADIIHAVKSRASSARNVKVIQPEADLVLSKDQVIIAGEITVTIERV